MADTNNPKSPNKSVGIRELKAYFNMNSKEIRTEWSELTDEDKTELKALLQAEIDGGRWTMPEVK